MTDDRSPGCPSPIFFFGYCRVFQEIILFLLWTMGRKTGPEYNLEKSASVMPLGKRIQRTGRATAALVLALAFFLPAKEKVFFANPDWEAGKGYFCRYKGTVRKEGLPRQSVFKLLVMKESPVIEAGTPSGAMQPDLIRMSSSQNVSMGLMEYHQMISVFFSCLDGGVTSVTMAAIGSMENAFLKCEKRGEERRFSGHSGPAEGGDFRFDVAEDFILYDSLPVYLASRLDEKEAFRLRLLPAMGEGWTGPPAAAEAVVKNSELNCLIIGKRRYRDVIVSKVLFGGKTDIFYFDSEFPNYLLKWRRDNGDCFELSSVVAVDGRDLRLQPSMDEPDNLGISP